MQACRLWFPGQETLNLSLSLWVILADSGTLSPRLTASVSLSMFS